ncbi:MAG: hypothetical protein DRJ03_16575 [Chloroflexi bacterium]|nr:MAG: hypothetical protein DRI81_08285 [Chloroflexota bacterium]RLC83634.1 MAG: hypothetical protein DRJ03_16575 [Chloroflexota bacterium]
MRCKQAGQMMSERLDGRLNDADSALLDEHLTACGACQAGWQSLQALDTLFSAAPMVQPPLRVRVQVMTRLARRDQARRAVVGGATLTLGTVSLALLALAPIFVGFLDATGILPAPIFADFSNIAGILPASIFADFSNIAGILPALVSGGPTTIVQLLAFLGSVGRALLVLMETVAVPLAFLGLCGLAMTLTLNGLWIGAVRRARNAMLDSQIKQI